MKRYAVFLLMVFYCLSISAQITVRGKVTTSKELPLVGASVYLNNTSIGTTTDDEGLFELKVPDGVFELIVSFVGFQPINYQLNTAEYKLPLIFKILSKSNMLDEVVISSKKKRIKPTKNNRYHFSRFRNAFIGRTDFAENCKIENPEVLEYYFDKETWVLKVEASSPLKIFNKDLGYRIYYDLVHFESNNKRIEYLGYTRYEKLKGSKRKKRRWKKNRLLAYNGSVMHFLRSLVRSNSKEEGFIIHQFIRKENKRYPSEEELAFSRRIFKMYRDNGSFIKYNKIIKSPKSKLDTALLIDRRARLKKMIDSIVKKDLDYKNLIYRLNGKIYLQSRYPLNITYTKEKEERGYRIGKLRLDKQISNLILFETPLEVFKVGQLAKPLSVLLEKYWGYEQFANALPLDYQPTKN